MDEYEKQLHELEVRESFALAQGREDLLDELDRERRELDSEGPTGVAGFYSQRSA